MCNISLSVLPNWLESVRIKRWLPCGEDGRADGRCTVTSLPNFLGWVDLLTHGAPLEIRVSQNLAKLVGGGRAHKGWEDRREMK